jgi:hypothetical protein
VLRQNPDADVPGCNADDEGENDRGLTSNGHQNLIAQPGISCPIEFRLIHLTYGGPVSTTTAIAWCYRAVVWGAPSKNDFNRSVRRALESLGCVKVGRSPKGRGRPWRWRLRNGGALRISGKRLFSGLRMAPCRPSLPDPTA